MLFSTYMDFLEGSEKEAAFFGFFSEVKENAEEMKPLFNIPLVGKMLRHILALAEAENVADFRRTESYHYFSDWNVKVHKNDTGDTPNFTMYPSDAALKKAAGVLLAIGAVVLALVLYKIIRKRCCKEVL